MLTKEEKKDCLNTLNDLISGSTCELGTSDIENLRKLRSLIGKSGDDDLTPEEAVELLEGCDDSNGLAELGYCSIEDYNKAYKKAYAMGIQAIKDMQRWRKTIHDIPRCCETCQFKCFDADEDPCLSCRDYSRYKCILSLIDTEEG